MVRHGGGGQDDIGQTLADNLQVTATCGTGVRGPWMMVPWGHHACKDTKTGCDGEAGRAPNGRLADLCQVPFRQSAVATLADAGSGCCWVTETYLLAAHHVHTYICRYVRMYVCTRQQAGSSKTGRGMSMFYFWVVVLCGVARKTTSRRFPAQCLAPPVLVILPLCQ